jgi:septal ring factor EnvC (AmiA/AmiB activator)
MKKAARKAVKKETKKSNGTSEAFDKVMKMTQIEALQFGKLDAEIRNQLQGMKLVDHQLLELKRKYQEDVAQLTNLKAHHEDSVKHLRPQYQDLVNTLAKKYGINDPKRMVIDPDSGTVRDARTDV